MHFQIYQFSWGSSIDLFDGLGLHKVKLINSKIAMEFVQAYPTFKRQFVPPVDKYKRSEGNLF